MSGLLIEMFPKTFLGKIEGEKYINPELSILMAWSLCNCIQFAL